MPAVSYRSDPLIQDYLGALASNTCPAVLKPLEWSHSKDGEYLYVEWPECEGSLSLDNIWKGMRPKPEAKLKWARQFLSAAESLDFAFARLFMDVVPRISATGDLYLHPDYGIQRFFQNLRPVKNRDALPWSFILTSSPNKKIIPSIWLGLQVYALLTDGASPLAEKFRMYLTSVPPGVPSNVFGSYPEYQSAEGVTPELNEVLKTCVMVDSAYPITELGRAIQNLRAALS